jgi:hypothetical protein
VQPTFPDMFHIHPSLDECWINEMYMYVCIPYNFVPYLEFILYFSDSRVSKIYGDLNAILISGVPRTLLEEARSILHSELKKHFQSEIEHFWVYSEKRMIVVKIDSAESVKRILQVYIFIQQSVRELPDCINIGSFSGFTIHSRIIVLTVVQYHSSLTLFNLLITVFCSIVQLH